MDAATIHAKIYAGRGKAALRLGLDYQVYRPASAENPLTAMIATVKAAFNSGDNTYAKPNEYNDPIWFGDFDGNLTLPGDYLVRNGQTYFVAGQQPLLPIICIDCNRSIKITRNNAQTSVGALPYGGRTKVNSTDIIGLTTRWPCSILFGGRRQATGARLPADVEQVGFMILLPKSVPVVINAGDIATDDLGRRYVIEGSELTDLGYRIIANEAHT